MSPDPDHAQLAGADLQAAELTLMVARLMAQLESMPVIEQAKGIIMARTGLTEASAFDLLRRASQQRNVPVRDLATQIIASAAGNPQAEPGQDSPIDDHRVSLGQALSRPVSRTPGPEGSMNASPGVRNAPRPGTGATQPGAGRGKHP